MSKDPRDSAEKLARSVRAAIAEFQEETGGQYRPEIFPDYIESTPLDGNRRTFVCGNVRVEINMEVTL